MPTPRAISATCTLGLLALLATACSTPASSRGTSTSSSLPAVTTPQSVITPSMVPGLLSTYDSKNNAANAHLSVAIQDTNEEGSAAAIDDEGFVEARDAGYKTSMGATYYPFTFQEISADVVFQASYPAVAAVLARDVLSPGMPSADKSRCSGDGNLFIFAKDSASAPWRVEFEPVVSLAAVPAFTSGKYGFGFGAFSGSPQTFRVPLQNLRATYAAALQAHAESGTLMDGLSASMFSGNCAILPNFRSQESKVGLSNSFTFSPSAVNQEVWEVKGGALVVLGLSGKETTTPPLGATLVHSHTAGDPVSFDIAAGNYASLSTPFDEELVVFDPYSTSPTGSVPVGSYFGFLAGTGTPVA